MDPQQVLSALLVIVVIANVVLILVALVLAARRRRQDATAPAAPAGAGTGTPSRTAAFGAPGVARTIEPAPGAGMYTDALTGLLLPVPFARLVADEDQRIQRYRRPATIVMVEVEGLDRLVDRLGDAAIDRLIPAVADSLRRNARTADHVARLATGRFAVLLPETDEVQAINYVERVRTACDLWLESGAVSLRLAIGWASATESSLAEAQVVAASRMFAEMHRAANRQDLPGGPAGGSASGASGAPGAATGPASGPTTGMEPAFGN
jgi:diguanylate cyclase (GGDEF)-like protein